MKVKKIAFRSLLLVISAALPAPCQEAPTPGSIKMLPGYHHRVGQGIDTRIGVIWKNGGLLIHYDIGELAGDYTQCGKLCDWTSGELWRTEQNLQGHRMVCVFTSKRRLVISFPESHANFYATVRSERELTDMLLMLLTFQSPSSSS